MTIQNETNNAGPPLNYPLSEVSVSITRHAGARVGSTPTVINVNGTGQLTFEQKGNMFTFSYASQNILALLNSLYKIRFFDLPTRYRVEHSVYLKENGTVATNALKMNDQAGTTVCFRTSNFEKCVSYSSDKPKELDALTQSIFSEAERLANLN